MKLTTDLSICENEVLSYFSMHIQLFKLAIDQTLKYRTDNLAMSIKTSDVRKSFSKIISTKTSCPNKNSMN
jgi:hypothetical protein